jgi:bacterioferritin-associated ferredoxin/ferredoxin
MVGKKAVVDEERCVACGNCSQRCETAAITLAKLVSPHTISVMTTDVPLEQIESLCIRAGFNPSQILCYCTATRADEVAAAIIKGAHSPEEITLQTGLRSGCSVECIQPALRLLDAHGVTPTPPKGGWQWYGRTPKLQEIPDSIKAKYRNRGFYFDEDIKVFESVVQSERR